MKSLLVPEGEVFGLRGSALHVAMLESKSFNPVEMVMLVELCRMADRLEQINELITSKDFAVLLHLRQMDDFGDEDGVVVIKVTIDSVLAEARQLQLAFQRVAGALNVEAGDAGIEKGDLSDDLAAGRADRIARATGS